jgi:hypothetical protein
MNAHASLFVTSQTDYTRQMSSACHLLSRYMKIQATFSSEASVDFQRTTWGCITECFILYNDRCENLNPEQTHDISAVSLHKQMAKEILVNISFCVVIGAFATKRCKYSPTRFLISVCPSVRMYLDCQRTNLHGTFISGWFSKMYRDVPLLVKIRQSELTFSPGPHVLLHVSLS